MKYVKYTDKDNIRTYHYNYSDLKRFLKRGFEYGDCGFIVISRNLITNEFLYKGFGTIENPSTLLKLLTIVHYKDYDGEIEDVPIKEKPTLSSYRLTFLNFNNK